MSLAVLLSHVASSGTVANRSRAQGLHFVEAERVLKHLQALRDLLSTLSTWSPVSLDSFLSRAVSHKMVKSHVIQGQIPSRYRRSFCFLVTGVVSTWESRSVSFCRMGFFAI